MTRLSGKSQNHQHKKPTERERYHRQHAHGKQQATSTPFYGVKSLHYQIKAIALCSPYIGRCRAMERCGRLKRIYVRGLEAGCRGSGQLSDDLLACHPGATTIKNDLQRSNVLPCQAPCLTRGRVSTFTEKCSPRSAHLPHAVGVHAKSFRSDGRAIGYGHLCSLYGWMEHGAWKGCSIVAGKGQS